MLFGKSTSSCMYMVFGVVVGIVISPVMWLSYQDPLFQSLNPLCTGGFLAEKKQTHTEATSVISLDSQDWLEKRDFSYNYEFSRRAAMNKTKLSFQQNYTVTPSGDKKHRYRSLSYELAPRKLLFIGVVTAKKYLNTRAVVINNTWGRDNQDLYYFSSHADNVSIDLPIITLPGVNDSMYPPQRKVYHMLKYMHDHFIEDYDFFMRSDDDVYVKMDRLHELLVGINPAQDIYMGCPGFGRVDDRTRIKLNEDEHYCMGGPGVIFSRSALRKLAPHLNTCLETVVVSYNEDVEVGRCVSKMLNLQCTWAWEATILFWTDYKRIMPTSELYTNNNIKTAITLHPIKDPRLMYRVHQYLQELQLKRIFQKMSVIQEDIERVSSLVPEDLRHYQEKRWLWYDIATNPSSRYELPIWEYFNSTRLFLSYEYLPVVSLPSDLRKGINLALEVLIGVMNKHSDQRKPSFIPPFHLFDGFVSTDHSSGVQYTLHMSVHRMGEEEAVEYVANVFLPFQGAGMASFESAKTLLQKTVHLIVNVGKTSSVREFLVMYEDVCILNQLKTHLHVVISSDNNKARVQISDFMVNFPQEPVSLHELRNVTTFSHSAGYDYVAGKLASDDLLVFLDPTFIFTKEFIWHVHINTVQGLQAYFPVLFSLYKPDLMKRYLQRMPQMTISADSGFFLRYNYQVVAIYKSDYDVIRGVELTNAVGTSRNDDVRFVDKALLTKIYVMRGLEPYLRRNYRTRTCRGLKGHTHLACMNSKADAIGSKKILGSLLISHDLLDSL